MKFLFLAILLTLVSCSSTVVKKIGKVSKYAPAGYQEVGAIQYELNGAEWVVDQRREDAFKRMHESCNGSYKITREGRKSEFMAVPNAQLGMHYIEFQCTERTPASN